MWLAGRGIIRLSWGARWVTIWIWWWGTARITYSGRRRLLIVAAIIGRISGHVSHYTETIIVQKQ